MTKDSALKFIDSLLDEVVTSGQVIKARRLSLGLTQLEVAELTGLQTTFLSGIENDKRTIGVSTALKIGMAIGLHPSSILFPNGIQETKELKEIERKRKKILKGKAS